MLSLISSAIGFFASGLPKVLEYFQDKADKQHELKLAQMQTERELQLAKEGFIAQAKIEEIRTDQIAMQTDAQRQGAALSDNSKLMDRVSQRVADLNGIVRPAVTFIFVFELVMINFALVGWFIFSGEVQSTEDMIKAADVVFSADEMALLSGIISFWFGSRQWGKK